MRRLSKPYSTSIDGSFQIVKERKNKRSETRCCASLNPTPFAFSCLNERWVGGADRDRTGDPLLAKQVLSQLSYSPVLVDTNESHGDGANVVGLGRVELPTSALSGLRSNQLSYRPVTHEPVTGIGKRALPSAPCPVPLKQLVLGARSER